MVLNRALGSFCMCGLTALAAPAAASEWADRAEAAARKASALVAQRLADWDSEAPPSCSSPNAAEAEMMATRIERLASIAYASWQGEKIRYLQPIKAQDFSRLAPHAIELSLTVADAQLKHGCLDQADRRYRAVVATYTGSAFEAYRERARMGVDDVRAARKPQ